MLPSNPIIFKTSDPTRLPFWLAEVECFGRMITCHLSHHTRLLHKLYYVMIVTKLVIVVPLPGVFPHRYPTLLCSKLQCSNTAVRCSVPTPLCSNTDTSLFVVDRCHYAMLVATILYFDTTATMQC